MNTAQKRSASPAKTGGAQQNANSSLDNTAMLDHALAYAARGWHVFPCNGKKKPRTAHGLNDATTDADAIRAWWHQWPNANIGIATGASGLLVLDVDDGGEDTLTDHPCLPDTVESITGGGGRHILFKRPDGDKYKSCSQFEPGLDSRADGGYIVAPPSIHESGRRYEWEASSEPDDVALAEPPAWLVEAVRARAPDCKGAVPGWIPAGLPSYTDDMLAAIPADDREIWIKVGMALHHADPDKGLAAWESWSRKNGKYKAGEPARKWAGFGGKSDPVTIASVYRMAVHHGWQPAQPANDPEASELPEHPDILRNLPYGLGEIQRYIYGMQVYPDMEVAGIAALATVTLFAQSKTTVDSYGGLGLNEQYMILAATGSGKESVRKAISNLKQGVAKKSPVGWGVHLPMTHRSAPASKPALHMCLQEHPSLFYMADEFGEWLAGSTNDANKRDALGYMMELYTSALALGVTPSQAVTREYLPVDNPRVSAFATSTAERMVEAMSASAADSGAFNRWQIFVAPDRPQKRYEGFVTTPPARLLELLGRIAANEQPVSFEPGAWAYFKHHDQTVIEPLKDADHALAGRLSEQAIKTAAKIALTDDRHTISRRDLEQAYAIREGLYHRAAALVLHEGAFSGRSKAGDAIEQVADRLKRNSSLLKSQLGRVSRKYKSLEPWEQNTAIKALIGDGRAIETGKRLYWCGDAE